MMEIVRPLPPRKNLTPTRISKQYLSPLQVLLQSGFQRHRAEKALAATGHRSAQLAADWLLAHVNDPMLDSPFPREYIVYACPYGELLQQLELFSDKSLDECGWNGAHNFIPHVTLVSFFKAPDECSHQLAQTLEQVVKQELESSNSATGFTLEPYLSPNFMGLFVPEDNATILKHIALQYVKEVSNAIINDNYEQLDAIATCFPWCTNATSRFSILPKSMQSISLEPHVKSLHLTLAYQFQAEHFEMLKQLAQSIIDTNLHAFWEIRLYSRDSRVVGKQVYKVIYSYTPKESDELELRIGDFIYVAEEANLNSSDGWVEGTSWLTGCTGFFPINYTQRTAETDSWTLHKSVPLFERDLESDIMELDGQNTDEMCNTDLLTCDNASTASLCSAGVNSSTEVTYSAERTKSTHDLYIMRHGERMDFCFGNWISMCISKEGKYIRKDLNMPTKLPKRYGYPNSFRDDTPLTNVGVYEATLTGQGLSIAGVNIRYAVSSPALRCVQTCHSVLTGLGIANQLPIKIEGGLFEWLTWYQAAVPVWMTDDEFIEAGFKIDKSYQPVINRDDLKDYLNESCSQYYARNFRVVQHMLKTLESKDETGAILLVAHASSLDTCSRELCGMEPRTEDAMNRIMAKIPYCSLVQVHRQNKQWKLTDPPVPGVCHSTNKRFDWKVITDE